MLAFMMQPKQQDGAGAFVTNDGGLYAQELISFMED
jgi:hypothetical protein